MNYLLEVLHDINKWGQGTLLKYGFLESLIFMFVFLVVAGVLKKIFSRYIRRKQLANESFIMRMIRIILNTIAIYGCLSLLTPFDSVLSKVWGSAGILAVVIGLAAQESMGNFVNGILITTFKPFKIGDLVKVNNGEYEGYVVDISLRDTVIRTYENTKIIIPNSTMNKAVLENVSLSNNTKGNFLTLDIGYESELDKAIAIMKEEIIRHPNYVDARTEEDIKKHIDPVIIRLTSFNDSSITLRATVYSKDNSEGFAMLSDLRMSIKRRFDKEGIEFPFPHRTIVYKSDIEKRQKERSKMQ